MNIIKYHGKPSKLPHHIWGSYHIALKREAVTHGMSPKVLLESLIAVLADKSVELADIEDITADGLVVNLEEAIDTYLAALTV